MKNPSPISYFKALKPAEGLFLMLDAIDEFVKYAETIHAHQVFILKENETCYFACLHQGTLIGHPTLGFSTIEDYLRAKQNKFPDAASYYDAVKEGYTNYGDYRLVKEAGISDAKIFEKIKTQGYIAGYEEFRKLNEEQHLLNDITNPYQLYKHAADQLFNDYKHFSEAFAKGYTDAPAYAAATEKGFNNAADYRDAQATGFFHGLDYYKAKEIKARDHADYSRYIELEYLGSKKTPAHDGRVLLDILSKLPQGKKISVNKLTDHLNQLIGEYKYPDTVLLPEWFITSFSKQGDISRFLASHEEAKKFGVYDNEGEYFETKHLSQRKVVLDGANVAHGSRGNDKSKPTVANIIKVVTLLKEKGFTEIFVISDASLRHRLTDKEKMVQLEELCRYLEAPAETPADKYLISFVKMERCLLVTNDVFREWKIKDPWIAENIDYYKLSFMIEGDKVIMPDLENMAAGETVLNK